MKQGYASKEVMALTGITARQLQWWDERGVVCPERECRNRIYSMADLAEVSVICELRDKGFSLQRIRKIIRSLQRELGLRLVETISAGSEYHLLTDGNKVFLENSAHEIIDILKNARQPIFTVCLTDAVKRIQADVKQMKKANGAVRPRSRNWNKKYA